MLRLNECAVKCGVARRCGRSAGASIANQATASNAIPSQPIEA